MVDFPQCTAEQVLDVAEAVVLADAPCSVEFITSFVQSPPASIEKALKIGELLGIIVPSGASYEAAPLYRHYLAEASEPRKLDVLRFALEAYPAYRFFKRRLSLNREALRAARETKANFGFGNHESEVKETLVSLGQYCGSLTYSAEDGLSVTTSAGGEPYLAAFDTIAEEGAAAEDIVRERLGLDAYAFIQDENDNIVTNLRPALQRLLAGEAGREIVVFMGNACENFLIKLAATKQPPVPLTGATGIIKKGDRLKSANVIAAKHLGFLSYLGQLRNAADHGVDTSVNLEWQPTQESVRQGVLVLLAAMRSMVAFTKDRRAEF